MCPIEDLTGQVFDKWTVIGGYTRINSATHWNCRCVCGFETYVNASSLKRGLSTQCKKCSSTTHGFAGNFKQNNTTHEYNAWASAKSRCTNPNNPRYDDYGGRGILMYPDWITSFESFYAHIGPCPDGMVLDRINNDLGYVPGNVRWVTYSQSNFNRRKPNEAIP